MIEWHLTNTIYSAYKWPHLWMWQLIRQVVLISFGGWLSTGIMVALWKEHVLWQRKATSINRDGALRSFSPDVRGCQDMGMSHYQASKKWWTNIPTQTSSVMYGMFTKSRVLAYIHMFCRYVGWLPFIEATKVDNPWIIREMKIYINQV